MVSIERSATLLTISLFCYPVFASRCFIPHRYSTVNSVAAKSSLPLSSYPLCRLAYILSSVILLFARQKGTRPRHAVIRVDLVDNRLPIINGVEVL